MKSVDQRITDASEAMIATVTIGRHSTPPRPGLYFARSTHGDMYAIELTSVDPMEGDAAMMYDYLLPECVEWFGPLDVDSTSAPEVER